GPCTGPRLRGHGKRSRSGTLHLCLHLGLPLGLGLGLRALSLCLSLPLGLVGKVGLRRAPPAPPGRRGVLRLRAGTALARRSRDLALQERVDG
ncbi:hypothetical protein G3I61_06925, partial [Streptomyces diastaticus]|nr:hypothetical protein [Streptomyces diastaticus]